MRNHMRVTTIKGLTVIALITAVLSGCCLDSASNVPMITFGISMGWLLLICISNSER